MFEGKSIFDENIKNRINYVYLDYYHHIVTGLTSEFKIMIDFDAGKKVLSKNMDFKNNLCSKHENVCNKLTKKIQDFDKFHNKRIFNKIKH
jgi:hypothetical protein